MSGDIDSILQLGRELLGEGQDEMPVQCSSHPSESVDPLAGSTSLFETGDAGLGGPHAFGEFPLAEAGFGARRR